jgi:Ca2+-binding RTX toxin-like protein
MDGGPGNDTLEGSTGADILHGGDGTDHVNGDRDNDKVFGDGGDGDFVDGSLGDDTADGGAGNNDTVLGGLGLDNVNGGPGNQDVVRGGTGNDQVDGGPGAQDVVSFVDATPDNFAHGDAPFCPGNANGVYVNLGTHHSDGDGNDNITGVEDVIGSGFRDCLIGDTGNNRLDGNSSDDFINGGGQGGDEDHGGTGSDACSDTIQFSCGPEPPCTATTCVVLDQRIDGSANLSVTGSGADNDITIGYGARGYTIDDALGTVEDQGGTCIKAGNGQICPAPATLGSLVVSAGAGNDSVTIAPSVPASSPAKINGEGGNDNLQGGNGDDLIDAGADGLDVLNGGPGNDGLTARSGKDIVNGEGGNDLVETSKPCEGSVLNGGPGSDNASFAPSGAIKGVDATIGGNATIPGVGNCNPTKIDSSNESLEGSFGNDHLVGDSSNNQILGQPGDDTIEGGDGNDTLNGSDGRDTLLGQGGKDELRAQDGTKDVKIDCGPPKTPEVATRDANDPPAINCGAKSHKKKKGKKKH